MKRTSHRTRRIQTVEAFAPTSSANISEGFFQLWILRGRSYRQQTFNRAHNRLRAVGERGNSLLKVTCKALRNISLDPWRIGGIVAAALVVLHLDHARTT